MCLIQVQTSHLAPSLSDEFDDSHRGLSIAYVLNPIEPVVVLVDTLFFFFASASFYCSLLLSSCPASVGMTERPDELKRQK